MSYGLLHLFLEHLILIFLTVTDTTIAVDGTISYLGENVSKRKAVNSKL